MMLQIDVLMWISDPSAVWKSWEGPSAHSQDGGAGVYTGLERLWTGHRDGLSAGSAGQGEGGHEMVQDSNDSRWEQRLRFDRWEQCERHEEKSAYQINYDG